MRPFCVSFLTRKLLHLCRCRRGINTIKPLPSATATTTKKLNCENISSHLIRTVANSVVNSTKKELQRSNRCAALCNLLLQYYLFLLHKNFDLGGAACRRDFVSSNKISGSNNRANQNVSEFGAGYFAKI